MENQLKFVSLLSLKDMALRKVAVLLWSDSVPFGNLPQFRDYEYSYERIKYLRRKTVEIDIKNKVLRLKLPKSVTKQITDIVIPIGLQVIRWKDHQGYNMYRYQEFIIPKSTKLCWTQAGLIDYRKTAEELMSCDALDVVSRFKLACINCLEDCIPLLWEKLPKEKKDYFCEFPCKMFTSPNLFTYWAFALKGELSKFDYVWGSRGVCFGHLELLTSLNQWAFEDSAKKGNKVATEYFFQKLTLEEREVSVMKTAKYILYDEKCVPERRRFSETFCYLMSKMNPEQQMELIQEKPANFFLCFLYYPWPDDFLENVGILWCIFQPSSYKDLLQMMAFILGDHYFPKFFQEFFILSPLEFKKCFVNGKYDNVCFGNLHHEYNYKSYAGRFLSIFFNSEDSESIKVIFRNLSSTDRLIIMIQHDVLNLFYQSMLQYKWHMVELCLREALLSKEDRKTLKDAFIHFLNKNREIDIAPKFKRFFEFLDETSATSDEEKKAQKRKLDTCCPE